MRAQEYGDDYGNNDTLKYTVVLHVTSKNTMVLLEIRHYEPVTLPWYSRKHYGKYQSTKVLSYHLIALYHGTATVRFCKK